MINTDRIIGAIPVIVMLVFVLTILMTVTAALFRGPVSCTCGRFL
jgi:hypothetical protein